jgi:hypothetical protein
VKGPRPARARPVFTLSARLSWSQATAAARGLLIDESARRPQKQACMYPLATEPKLKAPPTGETRFSLFDLSSPSRSPNVSTPQPCLIQFNNYNLNNYYWVCFKRVNSCPAQRVPGVQRTSRL